MIIYIIISVLFFGLTTFMAERRAPEEYSEKANLISELGCQAYENNGIMQWGFKGFGIIVAAGIAANLEESFSELYYSIPLAMYGLFMFFTGVFSSKPFEHLVFYSIKESKLHNLFLQLSGMFLGLLIVMKLIMVSGASNRIINIVALIFVLYTSAQAGRQSESRGVYQRVMFLGSFMWLIYSHSIMMR